MLWFGAERQSLIEMTIAYLKTSYVMVRHTDVSIMDPSLVYLKTSYVMVRPPTAATALPAVFYLKTSYVMVRPCAMYRNAAFHLFKNILCYGSAYLPPAYIGSREIFKNILCYGSAPRADVNPFMESHLKTSYVMVRPFNRAVHGVD